MADILFDIGVTGVKDLREAAESMARLGRVSSKLAAAYSPLGTQTVKVVKEQNRLKRVSKELQRAYNENRISIEQYNEAINQEINNSLQKIKTDNRLIEAAKRKKQALDAENNQIARLTNTYRKDIVAKRAYLQAQRDIRFAEQRGIITQQQMQAELERTKLEFQQFTQGLANGANQFARYNTAVYNAMQRKKRFGQVGLQQVGYQVGDFIVQIQSGTDALVAFGQQGSQLAGIFGAKGAIFGAVIAAATAIGMVYKSIVEASKTTAEDIKAAFNTVPDYFDNLGSSIYNSFDQSFAKIEERYGKLIANIAKQGMETLRESALGLVESAGSASQPGNIFTRFAAGIAPGVVGQGPASQRIEDELAQLYESNIAAQGILDTFEKQVKEAENLFQIEQAVLSTYDQLLTISEDAAKAFRTQAKEAGIAAAIEKRRTKELEQSQRVQQGMIDERFKRETELFQMEVKVSDKTLELTEKLAERRQREISERFKGETQIMNQTVTMSKETLSLVEQNRLARERDIDQRFRSEVELFNMEVSMSKETLALVEKNAKAREKEINDRFAGETYVMNQAVKVSNDLLKVIENNAKEAAKRIKTAFETESFFFNVRFADEEFLMSQPVSISPNAGKSIRDQRTSQNKKVEDYITLLGNRYKKEVQLRGVEEDELQLQSALIDARQKYGSTATEVQMDVIETTLRLIDVERQHQKVVEEAKKKQEELSEMLGSSLENAMMSIVDGTATVKDAFKEMAAAIIKDLYRVLVVQQLVASFKTATGPFTSFLSGFNADGNAFSRGNRITAYANGGVVGGPTYFPMSGNRVGLMGEAGPEAIMPLSRGKDGKLGVQASGQGVTVNQNINISTGVQQTVRTEIKSLMPQIAEASKAAVADAKRRGGSYGRTFS